MNLFYVENKFDNSDIDFSGEIYIHKKMIEYTHYIISSTKREKIILDTISNEIKSCNCVLIICDTIPQMEKLSKNIKNSYVLKTAEFLYSQLEIQIKDNTQVFFCLFNFLEFFHEKYRNLVEKYNINVLFDISYKSNVMKKNFNKNKFIFKKFITIYDNYDIIHEPNIGKRKFIDYNKQFGKFELYNCNLNNIYEKDILEFDDLVYL